MSAFIDHKNGTRKVKYFLLVLGVFFVGITFLFEAQAESPSLTVPETMWVISPPVSGRCSEGDYLPSDCPSPTTNPSKCSCLHPEIVQVPVLRLPDKKP